MKFTKKLRYPSGWLILGLLLSSMVPSVSEEPAPRAPGNGLERIAKSSSVEIWSKENGKTVRVADESLLRHLCHNIMSLDFSEQVGDRPSEAIYALKFFDPQDVEIASVWIPSENWIGIAGNRDPYYITKGRVDFASLEQALLSSSPASPSVSE